MIDAEHLLLNAVVELDDAGVVQHIFELSGCASEPANTLFFNGLLTTFVPKEKCVVGQLVGELAEPLKVGYNGHLLVWHDLTPTNFQINESTKTEEI